MAIGSTIQMTAEQFLQMGEDPQGVRLELVDGEVAVSPSPVPKHANIVHQLGFILEQHNRQFKLGKFFPDVDTILGPLTVRRPDILFFSKDRLHLVGPKAMEGPPDLVIEVMSPSSVDVDRIDKFTEYETAGVANYWVIDPMYRTVEAWQLASSKYVAAGRGQGTAIVCLQPFPNLEIPLSELWLI